MQSELSKYNNDWYAHSIGASRLRQFLWYFINAVVFKSSYFPSSSLKRGCLRLFNAKVGRGAVIKPRVSIKYPWKLTVGHNSWIGEDVWIDNLDEVTIRNNVCISQGAMLLTGNHDYSKTTFDLLIKPITLEDGVWIGARSVVCPGVTAHSHAVLAVGSVATKDLDPYSINQGNPAVKIKDRTIK